MGNQYSEPIDPLAPVDLRHFHLGRVIGKGAFGKVRVVERRTDKKIYALKYMEKEHIIKQRAYRNIVRERQLLERVFHPFIVNLCYAFQDDQYLFMISDLMLGGDLRFHLTRNDHLSEPVVAFYAAEVASALIYLHSRNVIHRDVKPDNLLLDLAGHVHVTDFNCACILEDGKAIISETGTQGYMAPEVYTDLGYRESVDWWSLGVTLYELLHGERPFAANSIEELAHAVKNDPIQWRCECSPEMLNFVLSLMDRNVGRRLGCGPRGAHDVKDHMLMVRHGLDWTKVVDKEIKPPFVPDTTGFNFDARYELEELLLEDQPLAPRSRRPGPDGGIDPSHPMARELKILQDEFKHFDYNVYERYTGIVDPTKSSVGEPPSWVRCVDPPVPLPPSTAPSSPNLASDVIPGLDGPPGGKPWPMIGSALKQRTSSEPVLDSPSSPAKSIGSGLGVATAGNAASNSSGKTSPTDPNGRGSTSVHSSTPVLTTPAPSRSPPLRPSAAVTTNSPTAAATRLVVKPLGLLANLIHSSSSNPSSPAASTANNSPLSASLGASPIGASRPRSPDVPHLAAPKRALHRPELRGSPADSGAQDQVAAASGSTSRASTPVGQQTSPRVTSPQLQPAANGTSARSGTGGQQLAGVSMRST
ncbi:kinase-like domain-containing protein [Catenaria anguillulae PL171]|uniref:Kinase-like domain-containing protein n=1 Tax=Catenaria anguillulae PL171 TaxID=765915 RepID=A0A1Y2H5K1_9FUNG|nr:kinase-like domain-containing protein [Catenaria anguillulae PL171]